MKIVSLFSSKTNLLDFNTAFANGVSVIKIEENVQQPKTIEAETDEAVEAEEITETEKPKKRGRKKQIDAES